MNQNESNALADSSLPPLAVVLYVRAFRRFMNYETGRVAMSLARMGQELEYLPLPKSNDKPSRPTVAQVRHLVGRLIAAGLVAIVEKGDRQSGKAAVFCCPLARKGFLYLNEAQQVRAQGSTTRETGEKANENNVVNFERNRCAHRVAQHRSVDPYKDDDDVCARDALELDDEFAAMAAQAGLLIEREQLEAVFNQFRFSTKEGRNIYRGRAQWLDQWRSYAAAVKANQVRQGNVGGGYEGARAVKSTGAAAHGETVKRAAERFRAATGGAELDWNE